MPAFIDLPTRAIDAWILPIQGWVAAPRSGPAVALSVNGRRLATVLSDRPDVRAALAAHPYEFIAGVSATANLLDVLRPTAGERQSVRITLGIGDDTQSCILPIAEPLWQAIAEQLRLRERARAWCLARLLCPLCRNGGFSAGADLLTCMGCGGEFPQAGTAITMLSAGLRQMAALMPAAHISSNPYEELAEQLIGRTVGAGGWVLDCGAGSRPARMPNVVNVEIEDYFSTDVLAIGERLPFQDHVFDAALSLAVLEHVRDPFACARELVRVVKPGGEIVCSVPFLQPVHGYPDHYYNMTRNGLTSLFRGLAEVIECLTPPNGQPLFALQWILREYADGLPEPERARFLAMRVDELRRLDPASKLEDGLVTQLSEQARATIACLNTVRLRTLA